MEEQKMLQAMKMPCEFLNAYCADSLVPKLSLVDVCICMEVLLLPIENSLMVV